MSQREAMHYIREITERDGWGHLMREVGSILAEQADKTSGDKSSALFSCSNTIHALDQLFEACGKFDYKAYAGPDEYHDLLGLTAPR